MKPTYDTLVCAACRAVLLVERGAAITKPWRHQAEWGEEGPVHAYCSDVCHVKGPAKPIRDRVVAMVDYPRGKVIPLAHRLGASDALNGFDALSSDPHYRRGHADGMKLREQIEEFFKERRK